MDNWAPRDITAHLIGWNIITIKGCQQLINGELPFYFNDPGDDFCKINALLVQEYNTKDKKELLSQLDDSLKQLKHFLTNVDPIAWENDFGVTYKGYTITIKNSVEALIHDYINHRQQIEKWAGVK
jgi:hypothetical protein